MLRWAITDNQESVVMAVSHEQRGELKGLVDCGEQEHMKAVEVADGVGRL